MEKITVLMPVFNREKYIETAIRSIQIQTYTNLEILIYDDGSKDNTVPLIRRLMLSDSRIKLIEGIINKGVAYARNRLIEATRTRLACWQDSDDISHPLRLVKQFEKAKFGNSLVLAKWCWLTEQYISSFEEDSYIFNDEDNGIRDKASPTLMFPVDKSFVFNEKLKIGHEDWDWIERLKGKYSIEEANQQVFYYLRRHNDRIGYWKRQIAVSGLTKEQIEHMSYDEMVEYCKNQNKEK